MYLSIWYADRIMVIDLKNYHILHFAFGLKQMKCEVRYVSHDLAIDHVPQCAGSLGSKT